MAYSCDLLPEDVSLVGRKALNLYLLRKYGFPENRSLLYDQE